MCSALSTTIAVQEHYASNEGLAMMHMKHAVPIGGAIVHLCLDQGCTSGAQDSGPVHRHAISAELSHILGHEHHNRGAEAICKQRGTCHDAYGSRSATTEVQSCSFVTTSGAPQVVRTGARAGDFS